MPRGADLADLSREDLIRLIIELQRQLEELKKQNEELRRNQKRSAAPFSKGKPKPDPKKPGRKPGQGPFRRREEPEASANQPPVDVPVDQTNCPICGGRLEPDGEETVSNTDIPPRPEAETRLYRVHICRCGKCHQRFRGQHPDVAADQRGATAHRVGPRVKALAHALHYGHGVPLRRVPGEPTNNRAERALRPAVIARKVSHCSKTERGAEAYAAFHSVLQTAKKTGVSFTQALNQIFGVQ